MPLQTVRCGLRMGLACGGARHAVEAVFISEVLPAWRWECDCRAHGCKAKTLRQLEPNQPETKNRRRKASHQIPKPSKPTPAGRGEAKGTNRNGIAGVRRRQCEHATGRAPCQGSPADGGPVVLATPVLTGKTGAYVDMLHHAGLD